MRVKDEASTQEHREYSVGEQATSEAADERYAPRKLTFADNAVLTVKVLAGARLVLAAMLGLSVWTSTN
jgi:hypothetical protein